MNGHRGNGLPHQPNGLGVDMSRPDRIADALVRSPSYLILLLAGGYLVYRALKR